MANELIDAHDFPGGVNNSVALAADSEEEFFEAIIQYSTTITGYDDNAELREMIRKALKG